MQSTLTQIKHQATVSLAIAEALEPAVAELAAASRDLLALESLDTPGATRACGRYAAALMGMARVQRDGEAALGAAQEKA
jgi:hypothetical protein